MQQESSTLPIDINYSDIHTQPKAIIIDCRTKDEFEVAHLQKAVNVPLHHLSIVRDALPCAQEDSIFVYCKSGNRSTTFALYLRSIGFAKCQSIQGGFDCWGDADQC